MHILVKHKNVCPCGSIVGSLNFDILIYIWSSISQRIDEELKTIKSSYVGVGEIDLEEAIRLSGVLSNCSLVFVK